MAALTLLAAAPADTLPPLGPAGDPGRGKAIVTSRQTGLCTLCHNGPFPDPHLQGSIAPDLRGVGARLTPDQLRLRIADPARLNQETIMPAYRRTSGFTRPGRQWRDRPLLTDAQIEDVVAYLATLTEP
jgi:sulfur-oxidizing protein SoxX